MPTFYNFTQDGNTYSFDDVFVPSHLFRDGNLFTWGSGTYGVLGNNSTTSTQTPVTTSAGGANWKQVSGGLPNKAAIKTDGTLWTWGGGFINAGRLGNAAITSRSTPVTTFAGGTNWKQVSCEESNTAAIKTDGTLWVWGSGGGGILGNAATTGNISTPVTTFAGGTNWRQVSCSSAHTAAIKTDGTLWMWGVSGSGRLGNAITANLAVSTPVTTFAGGTNWKQVSCGNQYTAAIKTDGTLWTWGFGSYGKLGNNDFTNKSTPVTTFAGGNNWKQVSCGSDHTAAIKTDGTLWIWGRGTYGKLGHSTLDQKNTPVTTFAGGNNWKQVNAWGDNTSAVKTNGTLWTWGRGDFGQLANNSTALTTSTPVTTFAGGNNWKQVIYNAAVTYNDPGI